MKGPSASMHGLESQCWPFKFFSFMWHSFWEASMHQTSIMNDTLSRTQKCTQNYNINLIIIKLMFTSFCGHLSLLLSISLCLSLICSSFSQVSDKQTIISFLDYYFQFINNAMSLTQIKILTAHYHTYGQYKIHSIITCT